MLFRKLLTLPAVLAVLGSTFPAFAIPSEVFISELPEIQQSLPPGYAMRLPEQIRLGDGSDAYGGKLRDLLSKLTVKVFSSNSPRSMIVGLFSCETTDTSCLVGSFSADSPNSVTAIKEFYKHRHTGKPVSLGKNIQGYLLEGNQQNPPQSFSSLMWQQDGLVHTVSFPVKERQNILWMGYSMVHQPPVRRTYAKLKRPSPVYSAEK
ncbi:hypothetical protein NIES2107_48730 [Nostoc carneum NIES-2107]|nr:hypothetical protein NIES2107_48730 [Nostoc carneum NIES-2107]